MWFKNARIYQITDNWSMSKSELEDALEQRQTRKCGAQEMATFGWTPPAEDSGLIVSANGTMMICLAVQERLLPAAVVREVLEERLDRVELEKGVRPTKKEKAELKEEVEFELMPKAFTRTRKTYAYIDTQRGVVVIDASAASRAEELLTTLRECIQSFPVAPLTATHAPDAIMTEWLRENVASDGWEIGSDTELRANTDSGVIRGKNLDLNESFADRLEAGAQVTKLALSWRDRVNLVLTDDLSLRSIKFLDFIQDNADDLLEDGEGDAETFLTLMSDEFRDIVASLSEIFISEETAAAA